MQLKTVLPFPGLAIRGLACAGFALAACAHLAGAPNNPSQILANAPLRFEASPDSPATFVARGARYRFEFTPGEATLHSGKKAVHLSFAGSNSHAAMQGAERLAST